ncbi:probable protein arginine N-methyltransferase 6.1 [Drosophila persimilis]|uniref:probable protein arginine N-methyltransferase 6.1 n=1 Tax=Drosophila persimilis TaxID=7234 RepID=UPI000F08D6F8|nr:probable protein arginine N-methyltransferase 6.1 [Drosophila persimilis]
MVTNYGELVVKQNHCEDTVKVLHGRVADLELPEKVDGIVCNWMGHSLLWKSEILEVLEARDRWLKKNGFIRDARYG